MEPHTNLHEPDGAARPAASSADGPVDEPPADDVAATVKAATRRAVRDTLPLLAGLAPFSLAIGASMAATGMSPLTGVIGAAMLMAGTSQLAIIGLVDSGAGLFVAVGTALLINLRFVLYGAKFAQWFANEPLRLRLVMLIPLVDQNFVLCERAFVDEADPAFRRRYYGTISVLLIVTFLGLQLVGFYVGASVPAALGLSLAAPLMFTGLLAGALRTRPAIVAAASAAVVVVLGAGLPNGLAMPVAAIAGVVVASQIGTKR